MQDSHVSVIVLIGLGNYQNVLITEFLHAICMPGETPAKVGAEIGSFVPRSSYNIFYYSSAVFQLNWQRSL